MKGAEKRNFRKSKKKKTFNVFLNEPNIVTAETITHISFQKINDVSIVKKKRISKFKHTQYYFDSRLNLLLF